MAVENNFNLRKIYNKYFRDMNFSLIIAMIIIVIILSILSPFFFSIKNFLSVGLYASILGIMACGLTVSLLMGAFDLSQYALAAFVGIIVTITSIAGFNPILSIVIALIIGLVIGSIIV